MTAIYDLKSGTATLGRSLKLIHDLLLSRVIVYHLDEGSFVRDRVMVDNGNKDSYRGRFVGKWKMPVYAGEIVQG
jgi:hypothetical protein